nr:MAG TPA: hypothetical protein [Caudoviricetes sp.]
MILPAHTGGDCISLLIFDIFLNERNYDLCYSEKIL